jgi:multiple sugar transport system ATP-binding protein
VTSGSITLAGRRIDKLPPAKRHVAMAFEGYALYPPLSVGENIGFALRADRAARREAGKRVKDVAELLEIGGILDRRPAGLSGGQQQRASLARALVRDADLHLLDEPMSQLEPQLRAVLRGRVKALLRARGITAVFVTHDQTEANALADRIAVMEDGVLQQYGPPSELRDRPANLFVATFLGEPPMNAMPAVIEAGEVVVQGKSGPVLRMAVPQGILPNAGKKLVLGVRPHRLNLGSGQWRGRVVSNQWLGDQAHVALDVGGPMLVAVSHTRVAARVGDDLPFGFDASAMNLFDAGSGRALLHGGVPA